MKYFVLTAAALMMTISASAATIVSVSCGSFDFGGTGGSGTFVCPTLSSIDNGGTPIAEEIIYNQDYSNGLANPTTTQTIFGFSAGAANASDTLTSTGGSSSNPATSGDGAAFVALSVGPPAEPAGFVDLYTTISNAITVTYTNSYVAGSSLATTGFAQLVFSYNPAVQGSAPEPGSMMLLGSGLVAAGILGRKKLVRK
jgi:hypothetical protein